MIEINLIPDVKRELLKAQRTRGMVISGSIITSLITGGVVVVLLLYVYGVQTVRGAVLDTGIDDQASELAQVEDLSKILTIKNQLKVISDINAQKNIDSRIFDVITAIVPPDPNKVEISEISINSDESIIKIDGQTRAYESMAVFKKTLESAFIVATVVGEEKEIDLGSEISTSDVSYGESATGEKLVRFSIQFKYPEELFSPAIDTLQIKLKTNGNATDSYLGIPRSIFVPRAEDVKE